MSKTQYPCPQVQQHVDQNNGAFDLNWMSEHVKQCRRCGQITQQIRHDLTAAVDEASGEPPRN
jgi:hypothetical protein